MHTKACSNMALSQFDLSKILINNLKQFEVSPSAKLVLLYLADCYNPKKTTMYPKQETVADKVGISLSSVKRAIKELSKVGIIVYETKNTNKYAFTAKIFDLCNMTHLKAQIETSGSSKLTPSCHEQIKEHKKNGDFSKVSDITKKCKYHYNNQQNGQTYKTPEATRVEIRASLIRDDESPMTDKETAIKYVSNLADMMHNEIIRKQVEKVCLKWGFDLANYETIKKSCK